MKYIIETEMPLTEVYVAVRTEDPNQAICYWSFVWGWLYKTGLKPLPVSPMKEVGEEVIEDYEFAITSLSHGLKIVRDKRNNHAGLGGVEACLRMALNALETIKQQKEVQP